MPGAAPLVRLQDIRRHFRGPTGRVAALDGVSLDVMPGEIFGVIGRSGAGKSTLIRCVNLLERPDSGRVLVDGHEMLALDRAGLLSDVTRVLSEHHVNILSATVSTSTDRLALSRFLFEMGDTTHLDRVLNAVRRIEAVYDVYRVSAG